jgi:hypothetical protein
MKTQALSMSILIASSLLAGACAPTGLSLSVDVPDRESTKLNRIALVMFAFEPVDKPVFPLIDAAFIRTYVNSLAPEIQDLAEDRLNDLRNQAAASLASDLHCTVLYGPTLHQTPGYQVCSALHSQPDRLRTDDSAFPEILLAEGDVNFLPIEEGDIEATVSGRGGCAEIISDLCARLGVDAVAIVHSHIRVAKPDVVMSRANITLCTNFYLLGPNGKTFARGDFESARLWSDPGSVNSYASLLSRFPKDWRVMMNKLRQELQ